jgi:quinol monooxygenase YgiN
MPLTVIAIATAKPGKEEQLKAELSALVAPSRTHDGCINYDLHQSKENTGEFMFHENWESAKHLEDHIAQPVLQDFIAKSSELLAQDLIVSMWENIS